MSIEKDLMDLEDPKCLQKQRKVNDAGENTSESIDETLAQRGTRYGSFKDHATVSQTLQRTFMGHYYENHNHDLEDYMKESAVMICHKLARIANGDPHYDDNWRDIAGYAQLVVDILHGKNT